jgi:UPF0716 protein FxsA
MEIRTSMPLLFLFFLFLAVYAELSVIINVGAEIGTFGVIAAMVLTAAVGLMLVRIQGFDVYRRMTEAMSCGEAPVDEMLHGVLLFLSGFLLIIPGFITDGIGALLLIPFIRSQIISRGLLKNAAGFYTRSRGAHPEAAIIEGEYEKKSEEEPNRPALGGEKKD